MVKMIYKGVMSKGVLRFGNGGSIDVELGKTYDIPDTYVNELLASGYWKMAEEPKPEKIIKTMKKKKIIEEDE